MASETEVRDCFRAQVLWCRAMRVPVYERLSAAIAEGLTRETRTGARVLDWPGDPNADALPLRLLGGLNALVRERRDEALATVFAGEMDGAEAALAGALRRHDDELLPWLDGPPQTNEVGRAAAITAALLVVAKRFGPAVELLELGSSGGLLLNLARYRYDLGDAAVRERLLTYIWPEQPERLARLRAAMAIARAHPPRIDRADGADWIVERLGEPQGKGVTRVVFHSVALQYFPPAGRERVRVAIEAAGARATPEQPLAWVSFEMDPARGTMALRLRTWPGGGDTDLATCHPHATWMEWHGWRPRV